MAKLPVSEAKVKIKEKKIKKALKIARLRPLKNFFLWFSGVLCSFAILFGGIFVAVKVVPISTYVGKENSSDYVSDKVSGLSFLDAVMRFNTFTVGDFPIVQNSLEDLLENTDANENTKLSEVIAVDYDKLNGMKFTENFAEEFSECITLKEDGFNNLLGDDVTVAVFSEYTEIKEPELKEDKTGLKNAKDAELYYCKAEDSVAGANFDTDTSDYVRIFDDDGNFVVPYENVTAFYLVPALNLNLTEIIDNISIYINYIELTEILDIFKTDKTSVIYKALSDITIGNFTGNGEENGSIIAEKLLGNITLGDFGGAESLGDIGNMNFFKGFTSVKSEDKPELDGQGVITKEDVDGTETFTANPKLFYVLVKEAEGENPAKYARAFSDDGEFFKYYYENEDGNYEGTNTEDATPFKTLEYASVQLYYPDLTKVSFSDAVSLLGECVSLQTVPGLFETFGVTLETDSFIYKVMKDYTIADFGKPVEEGGFDIDSIKATTVLGDVSSENLRLYSILCEATYSGTVKQPNELNISDLKNFNLDLVRLSTALGKTSDTNPIMNALLSGSSVVTIGNISERINALSLWEVYGETCFTTTQCDGVNGIAYYKTEDADGNIIGFTTNSSDSRVKDNTIVYYLSKTAGVWALVCCDTQSTYAVGNENAGRAIEYAVSTLTIEGMNDGTNLSEKLKNAKIRQLVDAGIVDFDKAQYYDFTLTDLLDTLL